MTEHGFCKRELAEIAEEMLALSIEDAEEMLDILDEGEREDVVSEIIRALHRRQAAYGRRRGQRRAAMLIAPKVMLNMERRGGEIRVRHEGRVHSFENTERALVFCDCVRELAVKMAMPCATYRREYPSAVDVLYPEVIKKKVILCVKLV